MGQDVTHPSTPKPVARGRRRKHLMEKMETYVGAGAVIIGSLLLAVLVVAFMQTGSGTPAWMQ